MDHTVEIRHGHLFCGLGGGAKGFNRGSARVGNMVAKFRCVGGIDSDAAAIRDFDRAANARGTVLDLFSREQYVAFHGKEPPADWREATPADIANAMTERPHIWFLSAPCKGFSGLLPETMSASAKYQALNGLTLRGVWLAMEAYRNDPVELLVFENVPRIQKRGRHLLDQIIAILRSYGYAVNETTHDCGVIGGLAQSRKRFLLVARHEEKVKPFLYEPEKRRLRGVGEAIGRLPVPGVDTTIPMHRMPALQMQTWVRLAFVRAGSDWRSLNDLAVENGVLRDFALIPDGHPNNGVYGVKPWTEPAATVTGASRPVGGAHAVADPRAFEQRGDYLGVRRWDQPSGTISSRGTPTTGPYAVADPRGPAESDRAAFAVGEWGEPAGVVTGQRSPGQGRFSVADPRIDGHEKSVQLGVGAWEKPSATVKGDVSVGTGRYAVADPRLAGKRFNATFRIVRFDETSPAVAGPGGPAGGLAVADPRGLDRHVNGKYRVSSFDEPAGAVIAGSTTGNGAFAVADPRRPEQAFDGAEGVIAWEDASGAIAGKTSPSNGRFAVADPRPGYGDGAHTNILGVTDWDKPARTVTGAKHVAGAALSIADPRYAWEGAHENKMAVRQWDAPSKTITGSDRVGSGAQSIADPRPVPVESESEFILPGPKDRLVAVIRALDGTWHRPFTTLELAVLQSLVDPDEILELDGASDSAWRERIGNAVPPDAAAAIAGVMGRTLLGAWSGETFVLSSERIWVRPLEIALAVDQLGNIPMEAP